ncbi:energy transducer TonB [soil metagenome]
MEAKKNPEADLTRKSGYFFSIGLLIALSLVVTAFEWRTKVALIDLDSGGGDFFEPPIDVVSTEILPPPPPVRKSIIIVEVDNDINIDDPSPIIDMSETDPGLIEILAPPAEPEVLDDFPVVFAEESASPKNGLQAFYKYVGEKIKYPGQARRIGIEGRVYVEFVINRDGSLSDVKAVKGIGGGCDEEAVRIIQTSPAWNPGKQRGKTVRQRYTLPIIFQLN